MRSSDAVMMVETPAVQQLRMENEQFDAFVQYSMNRFRKGDWGDVGPADKTSNATTETKYRFAKYKVTNPLKDIYIITEHDGSVTTVLFPDEY